MFFRSCFRSKKHDSFDHAPAKVIPEHSGVDDISDAFQSLSIKSEPAASIQKPTSPYIPAPSIQVKTEPVANIQKPTSPYVPAPSIQVKSEPVASVQKPTTSYHAPPSTPNIWVKSEPANSIKVPTVLQPIPPAIAITQPIATSSSYYKPSKPALQLPTFPLSSKPQCRKCGWIPKYRDTVSKFNQNNNADRPYYRCVRCQSSPSASPARVLKTSSTRNNKGWITWDDEIGLSPENPPCFCPGFASRQDRAGVDSYYPGGGFWTCASGRCDFVSYRRDGRTEEQAGRGDEFEPWLL